MQAFLNSTVPVALTYVGYDPVNFIDANGLSKQAAKVQKGYKFYKSATRSSVARGTDISIGPPTGELVAGACIANVTHYFEDRLIRKNRQYVSAKVECGQTDGLLIIAPSELKKLRLSIVLVRVDKDRTGEVYKKLKFKSKTVQPGSYINMETGYYTCKGSDDGKAFRAGIAFLATDPGIFDATATAETIDNGDAIGQIGGYEDTPRTKKACD